jgi:hypothetical protein
MADLNKIRERIREIARRRQNVELSEIEWVVNQLEQQGYVVTATDARHGKLFRVGSSQPFMVNHHNRGNKQVKAYSVKDFIDRMIDLDLYD